MQAQREYTAYSREQFHQPGAHDGHPRRKREERVKDFACVVDRLAVRRLDVLGGRVLVVVKDDASDVGVLWTLVSGVVHDDVAVVGLANLRHEQFDKEHALGVLQQRILWPSKTTSNTNLCDGSAGAARAASSPENKHPAGRWNVHTTSKKTE